jgi:hypothetical protein
MSLATGDALNVTFAGVTDTVAFNQTDGTSR